MKIAELLTTLASNVASVKGKIDRVFSLIKQKGGIVHFERKLSDLFDAVNSLGQKEMDVNQINFVDFNGTVITMTIAEVMELTELPQPNEYDNLTFEGWTKTLEEIQDGRCHTIGATYHTTDENWDLWVEIPSDGFELQNMGNGHKGYIDWGDGSRTSMTANGEGNRVSHTYEKKDVYRIKIVEEDKSSTTPWYEHDADPMKYFLEVHVPYRAGSISLRHASKIEKISLPDNGKPHGYKDYFLAGTNKLKMLVLGNSRTGTFETWGYAGVNLASLKYLVSDGTIGSWEPMSHFNLKSFSLKNLQQVGRDDDQLFMNLKYAVFDNLTSIPKQCFTTGGTYTTTSYKNVINVVDLPETLTSIANKAFYMGAYNVYIRSLTPPTLAGTLVFRRNNSVTVHIRKDATYTDASGNTWTGLDAYAHATNWATLYSNTNYTFIEDL